LGKITEDAVEVPDELRVALELAERTAAGKGRVATFAKEMANLLVRAEKKLEAGATGISVSRSARGSDDRVEYLVEKAGIGHEETLAEHRTNGKSKPFRCSKGLYDAVVKVLVATDRSLSVEEIASGVERLGLERPAEFQLRVPLRLWMHIEPALISRNRAKYRPIDSKRIVLEASHLWNSLLSQK
jgi:hypothetical protein